MPLFPSPRPSCMQHDKDIISSRFEAVFSRPEENHAALLAAVEQYCLKRSLSQTLRYRLGIIVDELAMNAIMHGGCTGEKHQISVKIVDHTNKLLVEVIDSGSAFDPTTRISSECPAIDAIVPIGGVGLCLVRRFADSMKYSRNKNRNRLLLSLNKPKTEDICSLKK